MGAELIRINLAGIRVEVEAVNRDGVAKRVAGYQEKPRKAGEIKAEEEAGKKAGEPERKTGKETASPEPVISGMEKRKPAPVISIKITPQEIAEEKEKALEYWRKAGIDAGEPEDSFFEYMIVHSKALEELIHYQIIHIHGTAICVNGQGYLFTAPSGTGKSTHTRLWKERYGDEVEVINDDKPLIRVDDGSGNAGSQGIFLCGNPWNGKHGLGSQIEAPLRAIVRLRRGSVNEISQLGTTEAFKELFLQTHQFQDPEKTQEAVKLLAYILERVPCYDLHCNKEIEAAEVVRNYLEHNGRSLKTSGDS